MSDRDIGRQDTGLVIVGEQEILPFLYGIMAPGVGGVCVTKC